MRRPSRRMGDAVTAHVTMQFLVEAFGSCLEPHSGVYCSAPITSGRKHLEWLRQIGESFDTIDSTPPHHRDSHFELVVEPNCRHARTVISRLRERERHPVIDPTAYPSVDVWSQPDWLAFWSAVITAYAHKIVFVDDWQYSNGCSAEYLLATTLALPCVDENNEAIAVPDAIAMLADSITEIRGLGGYTADLCRVSSELKRFAHGSVDVGSPGRRVSLE